MKYTVEDESSQIVCEIEAEDIRDACEAVIDRFEHTEEETHYHIRNDYTPAESAYNGVYVIGRTPTVDLNIAEDEFSTALRDLIPQTSSKTHGD